MIFNDLYKFSSVNVNALSALSNKCVWFAKQVSFNDPFEGIYKLNSQYTDDQLLEFAISMVIDKSKININEAREQIKANYDADQVGYLKLILDGAYKIHELKKITQEILAYYQHQQTYQMTQDHMLQICLCGHIMVMG